MNIDKTANAIYQYLLLNGFPVAPIDRQTFKEILREQNPRLKVLSK